MQRLLSAVAALGLWALPVVHADGLSGPVQFSLPDLDGEAVSLADFRGEWVVLNYWATWCAPCRKEIPDLSELHERRAEITVLGLAYEDADVSAFRSFLEEFPASYPILRVDVLSPPEPFGAPQVLPTSIVIDPDGRAVKTFVGPVTGAQIESWIDGEAQP